MGNYDQIGSPYELGLVRPIACSNRAVMRSLHSCGYVPRVASRGYSGSKNPGRSYEVEKTSRGGYGHHDSGSGGLGSGGGLSIAI